MATYNQVLDKNSRIPRSAKRFLSLMSTGNKHEDGEIRRLFIKAAQHSKDVANRRNASQFGLGEAEETANVASTVANVG